MAHTRGLMVVLVSATLTLSVTACSKPGGAEPSPTGSISVAPAGPLSEAEALDVIGRT